DLFTVFGKGAHPGFRRLREELDVYLPDHASRYWKAKDYYFKSSPLNPTFYYRGTAGPMAWVALNTFIGGRGKMRDYAAAPPQSS
ncbi:MAG: DUF3419 family protein, partial [Akkermansiaceae bacterium]|nr:DUF3419 family protein [Akkermansiaceae bacterium]